MKVVAYSEIPRTQGYVHLAYLSASSARLVNNAILETGLLFGALSLVLLMIGSHFRVTTTAPRLWRMLVVGLAMVTLLVLAFAFLTIPGKTRGMLGP